ncbi:MAG: HAMP domain-containing protein [Candidatus Abyssobacteria bacterium SURF_17]|uniref:histidine kinase n=1 Tax=Candidatus Abyssobacteria bacterium SURF_17 TaxID=2093361 RepID=A0A419F0G9_9BACT|nr:MAG: HAMP domain-containing protein [Candidatus Abyssubacteria bacterium SURF_17]
MEDIKPKTSLRTKILIGYLVLIVATAALAVWAIINFVLLGGAIGQIMERNYRSVEAAQRMLESLERQDSAELMYLFGHQKEGEELFRQAEATFLENYARAKDNITEVGEPEIINSIIESYTTYLHLYGELKSTGTEEPGEFYLSTIKPHFDTTKNACRELLKINQDAMLQADRIAKRRSDFAIYSTISLSALVIVFGLFFGLKISQFIIQPLQRLILATQEIRSGHLDYTVQEGSSDEIGILAREFNKMGARLKEYQDMNLERLVAEQKKTGVIVDTIDDCIIVTDPNNKIILLNPAAENIFKVREERARGKHFLEVINDESLFNFIKQTAAMGRSPAAEELEEPILVAPNGSERAFRKRIRPMKTEAGHLIGVVTVLQDITHLREVDKMKSEFISTVSHEFRTPLTSISMAVGLMLEETPGAVNEKQKELLHAAREDVDRLTHLVNNLLDLSRIESGRLELDIAPVDPVKMIHLSLEAFQTQLQEKRIELAVDVQGSPPLVDADATKIGWVISNLVGNALRYTESGGKITVGAIQKGERVHIWVQDTGPGIPEEYQGRIFEKFFQVAVKGKLQSGGAGLGLAICKEMVHAHGGRIWVESKPGAGSKFIFTLPVSKTSRTQTVTHA